MAADGSQIAVLVVRRAAEHPSSAALDRLVHEYALRDELDTARAARPLELTRERGRTTRVLEYPGGEPLERLLEIPMDVPAPSCASRSLAPRP